MAACPLVCTCKLPSQRATTTCQCDASRFVPAELAQEVFGLERYDLIGLDMEERKMGAFFTQVGY